MNTLNYEVEIKYALKITFNVLLEREGKVQENDRRYNNNNNNNKLFLKK